MPTEVTRLQETNTRVGMRL